MRGPLKIHYLLRPAANIRILRCIRRPYFFQYGLLMRLVYGVLARPHYNTEYLEVPMNMCVYYNYYPTIRSRVLPYIGAGLHITITVAFSGLLKNR